MVYELEQQEMTVEMKKGKPLIRMKEYSSRIVLQDNATILSDYKYYFNKTHQLKDIHAYSLVPEGDRYNKVPVKDFVRTSEIDDGIFYDDEYAYNFNFKSVGKGTKLVVESETELPELFIPVTFTFKRHAPVEKARLSLSYPGNVKIRYRLFGDSDTSLIKCTSIRQGNKTIITWEADEIKGFETDNVAPDSRYFIPHIIIQVAAYEAEGQIVPVIGTVGDLYTYCYKNLKDTIQAVGSKVKKLSDSLSEGKERDEDKVNAIYQWVQRQIRYVAIEDGENGVVPCNAELVLQRMYGDCKGKTSLLVGLLRSQNLKVSYAWVGTRSIPYSFSEFPQRGCSNHMVAVWWNEKGEPVILDGTTQFHRMYEIPAAIQGKECMIEKGVNDYMIYSIPVAPPSANTCIDSMYISFSGKTLVGTGTESYTGDRRAEMLYLFSRSDTSHYSEILSSKLPKASNKFIVNSVSIQDPSGASKSFIVNFSFTVPDYLTQDKDRIYVNLNLDRFPGNLSIDDDRTMPVEAEQPFDNIFRCTLKIPESYILEKIPDSSEFNEPEFGFSQHYSLKNGSLTLTTRVYFAFQVINGEKMKSFSRMLSALHRAYSKSIVLIKK